MSRPTITLPPEMLPSAPVDEPVQVVVVDPETGVETVVYDSEQTVQ